jgi:hypothetical protein
VATPEVIREFNESVTYAHFELMPSAGYKHALHFCMLKLYPGVAVRIQNIITATDDDYDKDIRLRVGIEKVDYVVVCKSTLIKTAAKTGVRVLTPPDTATTTTTQDTNTIAWLVGLLAKVVQPIWPWRARQVRIGSLLHRT